MTCAGRDTVNQLGKVVPSVIQSASSEINNIVQQRINHIIRQGGQEMEKVLPFLVLEKFIEEHSRTFIKRLLGC